MKALFPAAAVILATLTSAGAADLGAPAPSPSFNAPVAGAGPWSGAYAGVESGAIWTRTDALETYAPTGYVAKRSARYTGGVYAGYNAQSGNTLVGLEALMDFGGASRSHDHNVNRVGGATGFTTYASKQKIGWQGALRARVGTAINAGGYPILAYMAGGVAIADITNTVAATTYAPPVAPATTGVYTTALSRRSNGVNAGFTGAAGVEVPIMANVLARGEYRYAYYPTAKTSTHAAVAGVAYKW